MGALRLIEFALPSALARPRFAHTSPKKTPEPRALGLNRSDCWQAGPVAGSAPSLWAAWICENTATQGNESSCAGRFYQRPREARTCDARLL